MLVQHESHSSIEAGWPADIQRTCRWQKSHSVRKHWASEPLPGILSGRVRWLTFVLHLAVAGLKSRRNLLLEIHQLLVLSRNSKRPRLTPLDRLVWSWLKETWGGWKTRLRLVQPGTVLQRHRAGFRLFWRWKSRPRKTGRKPIAPDLISLIRDMNRANPLRGAPRLHGELLKLGITLAQRTVANNILPRARGPSPQNWKAFLRNHLGSMVSVDFVTVPTLTFQLLFAFIVLSHHRHDHGGI